MLDHEVTDNRTRPSELKLETWIRAIIPPLKERWADYIATLPPHEAPPSLGDWLALLHTAAKSPWKVPRLLTAFLGTPKSSTELQEGWVKLTNLFALTFEVAQDRENQLDATAWQNLLDIQNRILKQAAQYTLVRDERPATDVLTRRALYLQTVTDLNKKIVNTWDSNELLDEVVVLIQKNFGYDYVNLFLLDASEQTLNLRSGIWQGQAPKMAENIRIPVNGPGLLSRVAATGRMIVEDDLSKETSYPTDPNLPEPRGEMVVPLLIGNNLVGVLDIGTDHPYGFTEDDRQIARALADHVAVAIENARLQSSIQRHLREKTLLYESNVALGITLDMNTVLKLMAQKIVEALDAGACVICRVDPETRMITAVAEYVLRYPGNPPRTWRKLDVPVHVSQDPIGQRTLKTIRPVIGRNDPKKPTSELVWRMPRGYADTSRKQNWNVVLAVPLRAENQTIGLVEIYDKNRHRKFSTDDIQLCRILATQTTLAMERSRLFEETRQRLSEVSTLHSLAREISGQLEVQAVLDSIVVSIRQVIDCRGCAIFLYDESSDYLEIKAADGLKPYWRKRARLKKGEGAAGVSAIEARTIYIPDTHKEPGFIFFDDEVRSLMVIPLYAKGEVIGTINVDDNRPNAFGPTQERLLAITAAQAGILIENARLFARVSAERQQIQAIIQHMADGLILIDSVGKIVTCNRTLAMMLEMHPGQIIGQKIDAPNLHPNLAGITATTTHEARTGVLAKEVTIKDRTFRVFATKMFGEDERLIGEVRVVHDITRERELERLKDEFISTISHELRTPLFSIQGFARILSEENDLDDATRKGFLSTIQRQATQLSDMVSNLLDISRFDEGKLELAKEQVNILAMTHQAILKLQGFAHQEQVTIETNFPESVPSVVGDQRRLEQVLTNLIGNAIKFTPQGGSVTITIIVSKKRIHISVKDTGIGIPAEALEHIFARYYQVENSDERLARGSGLGLYIAQKIIESHGGTIWADSTVDEGSTFHFTIPLTTETTE